ncbi:hypothetical protein YC2023_010990 [Brassica napus]
MFKQITVVQITIHMVVKGIIYITSIHNSSSITCHPQFVVHDSSMPIKVGDTIALSARHKIAASEYYSGLRGSREPNEVQATIIGVVKLLVSLSFSFIQILMVHGS